jgi:hypothetical protein
MDSTSQQEGPRNHWEYQQPTINVWYRSLSSMGEEALRFVHLAESPCRLEVTWRFDIFCWVKHKQDGHVTKRMAGK